MDRNWLTNGICALALSAAIGCSSTQHATEQSVEQSVEIAPFDVPTSAPRPEADEPIERFVARWNAWVDSVPEDQRVGDAIEQAGERLRDKIIEFPLTPEGYDGWWALDLAKPGFLWEEARVLYDSMAPELDLMRELAYRDAITVRLVLHTEESVSDQLIHHSSTVLRAASGLAGRVRYMALAGRASETFDDVLALFEIKRLMMESPMLTGMLMASATRGTAWNTIEQALAIDPDAYTDDQLSILQDRLAEWVDEDMEPIFRSEEYFTVLQIRELYSDSVGGRLSEEATQGFLEVYASMAILSKALGHPIVFGFDPAKKRAKIEFAPLDQQIAMLKASNDAFIADAKAYPPMVVESHLSRLANHLRTNHDAVAFMPSLQLASMYGSLLSTHVLYDIEARAAVIVLAIHRHRLATGDWPESLEEISSEHLRVDPIDLHTGEIFEYGLYAGQPWLWSGGPDGDNDYRVAVRSVMEKSPLDPDEEYEVNHVRSWFTIGEWDALSEEDQAKYDGDWILFPPDESDQWGNEEE